MAKSELLQTMKRLTILKTLLLITFVFVIDKIKTLVLPVSESNL